MKVQFIAIISIVISTISWAKPASLKTMYALDDSELSKVTDHNHGGTKTKGLEDQHLSKEKQLNKETNTSQQTINKLILKGSQPLLTPSKK